MNHHTLDHCLQGQPLELADLIRRIAAGCAHISRAAARRGLEGPAPGAVRSASLGGLAQTALQQALTACAAVAGWASDAHDDVHCSPRHGSDGAYLVAFDALEGAADADTRVALGTTFSVLPHLFRGTPASAAAFMQPGRRQVAAGYAVYGASTVLVLSFGQGVQMFALDPDDRSAAGRWLLSREALQVPCSSSEFAINASNQRFWEKPVQRYVAECLAGQNGPRGRDFNMRWLGCLVAEVHRVFTRGGVYLDPRFVSPRDAHDAGRPGVAAKHLRLLFDAAPIAYLMEQAGGVAVNGSNAILDLVPDALQHTVPVVMGSREEVERIVGYHADPSENVSWQLFKTRSLFVQPQA